MVGSSHDSSLSELAVAAAHDAIAIADGTGSIVFWNPGAERLFGYTTDQAVGASILDLLLPPGRENERSFIREVFRRGESIRFRTERLHRDDGPIWVDATASPILDEHTGEVRYSVGVFRAERDDDRVSFVDEAHVDPLTELPNRRGLRRALERLLDEHGDEHISVLFIDLDGFKPVNDLHGHDAGDEVLRVVGRRLQGCLRPGDIVSRIGGDEFVAVLVDVDIRSARRVADRIRDAVSSPVRRSDCQLRVGASIGARVRAPGDRDGVDTLLHHADLAMYHAKSRGGTGVVVFDSRLEDRHGERIETANRLRGAIERGDLATWFQPLVDLERRAIVGAEALARWPQPDGTQISPLRFIPAAREIGVIADLDRLMLGRSVAQLAAWRAAGLPIGHVNVNVTRATLKLGVADRIAELVATHGLAPRDLGLELSEASVGDLDDEAVEELDLLDVAGFPLSLDDFGVAQSSLANLRDLPISVVKLDRRFVDGLPHSPPDVAIVRAASSLASALGLDTVAEGIEREEQIGELLGLGIATGQGHLFGKPMPPDALASLAASDAAASP